MIVTLCRVLELMSVGPESPDPSARAGGCGDSGWAVGPGMARPSNSCGIHATSREGLPVGPGFHGGLHAFGAIEQSSFHALPWRMRSRAAHRPDGRRTDSPCWAKIGIGSGFPRDGGMLSHANHGICLRILCIIGWLARYEAGEPSAFDQRRCSNEDVDRTSVRHGLTTEDGGHGIEGRDESMSLPHKGLA